MPPLSRGEFERLLRGQSRDDLSAFVADLWAARDWETERENDVVVATRDGRERRLLVYPDPGLLRPSRPSVEGTAVDVVVAARDGASGPARLARDADAVLVEATDLYTVVLYGIDRDTGDALLRRHFGRRLLRPDDGTRYEWFRPGLSRVGVVVLGGTALVVLFGLVMGGNGFLVDGPSSPSGELLATPVSPVPVSEAASDVRGTRETATSTANTKRWNRVLEALRAGGSPTGGSVEEIAQLPFYGMPHVVPTNGTVFYIVESQGLFRIDVASGDRWRFTVPGIIATEAVVGSDTVYLTFLPDESAITRPVLVAINETSATQRWAFLPEEGMVSLPAITNTTAYVSSTSGTVYALETASGRTRWRTEVNGTVSAPPVVRDGRIVVWTHGGSVVALDADTGTIQWRVRGNGSAIASLHATDGAVYVSRLDGGVIARDATTGTERWRADVGDGIATSRVRGAAVFVGTNDGTVYRLDATDGRVRWRVATDGGRPTPLTVDGRTVYVGTNRGTVHAIGATTGRERWRITTDAPVSGSPVVDDGHLYVANIAGDVYALDTDDGTERWRISVRRPVVSPPRVIDGVVLVSATDRRVHVLVPVGNASASRDPLTGAT